MQTDYSNISYCGCYCKNCGEKLRFEAFWSHYGDVIGSCRNNNCGAPLCEVRQCALQRNVKICAECPEYPCARLAAVAKTYPAVLANGIRIREIGLEAWVREQRIRPAGIKCISGLTEAGTSDID